MNIERLKQPDIGNLIRAIRNDLNLSQEKFASHLGVSFSSLNRWENHKAMPSALALKNMNIYLKSLGDHSKLLQIFSKTIANKLSEYGDGAIDNLECSRKIVK